MVLFRGQINTYGFIVVLLRGQRNNYCFTMVLLRGQRKNIGFIVVWHRNQRNNFGFVVVFAFLKQNIDFHWGHIVKQVRNHKQNIGFMNSMARDTPDKVLKAGRSGYILPRRTLAPDG